MVHTGQFQSPLGPIQITAENNAIVSLTFSNTAETRPEPVHPPLQQCMLWLDSYFSGDRPDPAEIPLRLTGTPFQQKVWQLLMQIPYGQAVTYGQIAKQIGPKMSAQAVGGAVGSNPVSIIVPCHRVLGADRRLIGYAYGLERKQALLDLENIPYFK